MAAAGFVFLALKISKEKKNKRCVGLRPALSKRKILTHTSLPYCSFDLLNSSAEQTAKGQHWAETSLQVVKVVTKQKLLIFTDRRQESVE